MEVFAFLQVYFLLHIDGLKQSFGRHFRQLLVITVEKFGSTCSLQIYLYFSITEEFLSVNRLIKVVTQHLI